jgi:hypothetical protein
MKTLLLLRLLLASLLQGVMTLPPLFGLIKGISTIAIKVTLVTLKVSIVRTVVHSLEQGGIIF